LFAASSLPLINSSGWKSWRYAPVRISSIGYISNQLLATGFRSTITYRRIEVDEDGARHIFPVAGLGEEGLGGAVVSLFALWVRLAVWTKAVLEAVTVVDQEYSLERIKQDWCAYSSQALLPSWTPAWPI